MIRSTWDLKRIKSFIEHRTEKKKNASKKSMKEHTSLKTHFHKIQEHALAWYKKKILSHSGFLL